MSKRTHPAALSTLIAALSLSNTGCFVGLTAGPGSGSARDSDPGQPVLPEDEGRRVLEPRALRAGADPGTDPAGGPTVALDPPSDDEVMRALEKANPIQGGLPFLHEVQRNNVRIVKEKIADYVDPPRVVPLIGPAQLHHAHYKCTIYYTEITRVGWPVPHTLTDEDAHEVIYIDHNHFHMVGPVDTGVGANF